jgi:RND family efflux transporter MFP subunit
MLCRSPRCCIAIALVNIAIIWTPGLTGNAAEVTGVTEANQKIEVACFESGVVQKLLVKEGQMIKAGQAIAQLDSELQVWQLELARHLMDAKGETKRAEIELTTKQVILEHMQKLSKDGFAQNKELLRAQYDVDAANAGLLVRQEHDIENELRVKLAEANLRRRTIVSPIDGVVAAVRHREGEFVSPVSPEIATVLQVDSIIAKFQISVSDIQRINTNQTVSVTMESGDVLTGTVDSIGVIAEAETVTVRVRLQNEKGLIRSGQQCHLRLPVPEQLTQAD